MSSESPNPLSVGLSVLWALRHPSPSPTGTGSVDHDRLRPILDHLRSGGVGVLPDLQDELASYRSWLESFDPDTLTRDEALAYWLNLYNTGALELVGEAYSNDLATVLRIPGGFRRPFTTVAGKALSLDDIEHSKIRRFNDPRVHGSLVCGSASCPTLRFEPFDGDRLLHQLDDQMRAFLTGGGAVQHDGELHLSRILLWFGGDFVTPHRMPTFIPARPASVAAAVAGWMEPALADRVMGSDLEIRFQPYNWSLACAVS